MQQQSAQQRFNAAAASRLDGIAEFAMHVLNGDVKMMELEIKTNPGIVNARDKDGYPMLHIAVMEAQEKAFLLLLDKVTDLQAKDSHGRTAADLAQALHFTTFAEQINRRHAHRALEAKMAADRQQVKTAIGALESGHGVALEAPERPKFKPK